MRKFFTIASLVALTLSACSKESAKSVEKGEGQVSINCVTVTDVDETRANVDCTTPAVEDFSLKIEGIGHTYAEEYATVAEFNDAEVYMKSASYKATVKSGDVNNEGFDKAAFEGSAEFVVESRKHTNVEITATIANALVKVEVTDQFNAYFVGGHTLKLTTAAGNEFDVTAQMEPLFIAPGAFTISGTAVKQPNQSGVEGTAVALPEYKNTDAKAQTLYTVKLDVVNAGSAQLTITLNEELVESIDIEQELNDNAK